MDWSWLTKDFLNGLGTVGISVLVLLLVVFGKGLDLSRVVKDKDKIIAKQDETIEWQRQSMDEKDATIAELLGGARVTAQSLAKVSKAAERIAGGEGT